jgi:predicted DNA-binding ribbon-helix-helix protein
LTQWGHVRTDINPADIATRYVTTEDLASNKLWFEGPPFLKDPGYKFSYYEKDARDLTKEGEAELKTITETMNPLQTNFNNLTDFNNFNDFIDFNNHFYTDNSAPAIQADGQGGSVKFKAINYWLKQIEKASIGKLYNGFRRIRHRIAIFYRRILKKSNPTELEIQTKVYNFLYRLSQLSSFPGELKDLAKGRKLTQGNLLAKMNPYIDDCGVLRSNSRLDSLDYLPEETRRPVILSGMNPITKLIVLETHWDYEHAVSRSSVLASLHRKYYIIGISKLVMTLSSNCIECKKIRAKPVEQIMAPLQNLGLPQRAFAETGLDFAGPFEIVQGRGKVRRQQFVLLLTCLQTRAVHFEPTRDQTTDAVLNALTRFCALRGRPRRLLSDNQTSFKSSSRELKSFYAYFKDNFKQIEGVLNTQGDPVEWEFITPRSPHHGGAWEIMVKAMKRALTALSKGQAMNEDTFHTYLCIAMNMINNRPLLKHYSQELPHFLTPNDFITGRQDCSLVPSTEAMPSTRLGNRWRQLETLGNQLWHRFVTEILPELAPRQKWKRLFDNLKEGTLVLVVEPGLPRGSWKVALVIKVELGRDGLARSAVVKIGAKEYDRPVTRLIPLID